MMVYEISRREVLNNLIRFKENLSQMGGSRSESERTYKVLLNRKTGDMRFPQKISDLNSQMVSRGKKERAEDWKEVRIIVSQKSSQEVAHFEVRDAESHSLKSSELEPLAWRVAQETLEVLNQKVKEVKATEMLPEEAVLQDLTSIHLESQKERIENVPGWMGSLSRIEAEERLMGKTIGTYLLREGDEVTRWMSFHFGEENHLVIRPYLLTVVENEEKISDLLILKTNKGWILYSDNPNLKDEVTYHYHLSPESLVRSLHPIAINPLL